MITDKIFLDPRLPCYQFLAIVLVCLTKIVMEENKPCNSYRLCPACLVMKTKVESQQKQVNLLFFDRCKLPVTNLIVAVKYVYTIFAFETLF